MSEFIITSADAAYTYTSILPVGISFENQNNKQASDTQGYLHKIQIGRNRVRARVVMKVSDTDFNDTLYPLDTYQSNVTCTFDRNIPGKSSTSGTFTLDNLRILQELKDGSNQEYEIEITLTEVLST